MSKVFPKANAWRSVFRETACSDEHERASAVRCSQEARLYGLTQREEEMLAKLVEGSTNREIGEDSLSPEAR